MNYKTKFIHITKDAATTPIIMLAVVIGIKIVNILFGFVFRTNVPEADFVYKFTDSSISYAMYMMIVAIVIGALTSIRMKIHMQFSVSRKEAMLSVGYEILVFFITTLIIFFALYLALDRNTYQMSGSLVILLFCAMFFFLGIGLFFNGMFSVLKGFFAAITIPIFILLNTWAFPNIFGRVLANFFVNNFSFAENGGLNFGAIPLLFLVYGLVLAGIGVTLFFTKRSQMRSNQLA